MILGGVNLSSHHACTTTQEVLPGEGGGIMGGALVFFPTFT